MSPVFKGILITSGPTIEPIDPVRFLSNRSSGKTGFHLAMEARTRNLGPVTFVTGPTTWLPEGVEIVRVETALEMRAAVDERFRRADVIIMAAAVSDYRILNYSPEKIKKSAERITLELVKNPDILLEVGRYKRQGQILVGFAAETEDIEANARRKLQAKNLDLLVLNEISEANPAFGCDLNQVFLVRPDGLGRLEKMSKARLAARIWDEIMALSGRCPAGAS
jgi:phosphopantothenoylcysteine decarboxylase/phosphopantothenate--cysteine ligase